MTPASAAAESDQVSLRPAARAIVLKDGLMLVMKRSKQGRKYMVTPGGRLEAGESAEEAVVREVLEETTIRVENPRLVFVEEPNDGRWGMQYIFLCEYVSGEPMLDPSSEEYAYQQQGGGTYEPQWLSVTALHDPEYPFRSGRLGEEIREAIENGFPDKPKQWTLPAV